jgi:hypothetical protein
VDFGVGVGVGVDFGVGVGVGAPLHTKGGFKLPAETGFFM